jgi:hypothetical protein
MGLESEERAIQEGLAVTGSPKPDLRLDVVSHDQIRETVRRLQETRIGCPLEMDQVKTTSLEEGSKTPPKATRIVLRDGKRIRREEIPKQTPVKSPPFKVRKRRDGVESYPGGAHRASSFTLGITVAKQRDLVAMGETTQKVPGAYSLA